MKHAISRIEFLYLPIDYYEYKTDHKPTCEYTELCAKMLDNCLSPNDIMNAMDSAFRRLGFHAAENELWKDIRQSCLEKWKEYKNTGIFD